MSRNYKPIGTGMKPCKSKLGKLMRAQRIMLNLPQGEAAHQSGISQAQWNELEVGPMRYVGDAVLQCIANALQLNYDDLKKLVPPKPDRRLKKPTTKRGKFIEAQLQKLGLSYAQFARLIKKDEAQTRLMVLCNVPTMRYDTAKVLAPVLQVELSELVPFMTKDFKKPTSKFGRIVRSGRKALGMSTKEMADKLDITVQMFNQIEHGHCPLCQSKKLVQKLAKVLKFKKGVLEAALPARKLKAVVAETPLGEFLTKRRIQRGLNLRAVNKLTGIYASKLSQIFRGKAYPDEETRLKISAALRCKIPAKLLVK